MQIIDFKFKLRHIKCINTRRRIQMAEKQSIIDRLYALRAGISVLSMQYDKYFNTHCEIEKIFINLAKQFDLVLGEGCFDVFHIVPFYLNNSARKHRGRLEYDGYHTHGDAVNYSYWHELLGQCCYFDLRKYLNNNVYADSHYKQLNQILETYKIFLMKDDDDYIRWQQSFEKASYEQQLARDCVINIVGKDEDEIFVYWDALKILNNIAGGRWLFTDEAYTHYNTKLKELRELVNTIHNDNEELKPKGFLQKVFNKNKNADEIAKNEKRMKLGSNAIQNAEKAIAFLRDKIPTTETAIKQESQQVEYIKSEFNQIFRALQDEFSSLLDVRDWENVDLVIYFMETGRADTIKEALQQVDMEKRTKRIVNTIQEATERICSTIAIGFATLNASMRQCFAVIESRIAEQNALLSQQNDALAELVSAANMSNALIAKQNTTSEKLMKDVKALKTAIVSY